MKMFILFLFFSHHLNFNKLIEFLSHLRVFLSLPYKIIHSSDVLDKFIIIDLPIDLQLHLPQIWQIITILNV